MKELSIEEVVHCAIHSLGMRDETADATSTEAVAAQLRRAAAFLCPCSPRTLVRAVVDVSKHFSQDVSILQEKVEDVLSRIIAYGDLIEADDWRCQERVSIVYATPPGFFARASGQLVLFGIGSAGVTLPPELETRIEQCGYARRLSPATDEDLAATLLDLGLSQVPSGAWLKFPKELTPSDYLMGFDQRLSNSRRAGDLGDVSILDPSIVTQYYRHRWRPPGKDCGRYVCRRPRCYGADLWCYVELDHGEPVRLLDLPIEPTINRGCDEAWRLQAAIDHLRHNPQRVHVLPVSQSAAELRFFSPVPAWIQRRLDTIGTPVSAPRGCLFSYLLDVKEVPAELDTLRRFMWTAESSK